MCFHNRICRNANRGQSIVETAIALAILLPFVFWVFEMAMLCYTISVIQYASRVGVQYASVHGSDAPNCSGPLSTDVSNSPCTGSDPNGALIAQVVVNVAASSGHPMPESAVTVTWPKKDNSPGSPIWVSINYTYTPWINLPFTTRAITGTATGTIAY